MFWTLVATIFAGIGCAGIALLLRKLTQNALPKWIVPVFAGVGMLSFQVYEEYTWFEHQTGLLPKDVVIVKSLDQAAPWRPWTYLYPQTLRFIAADMENASRNQINPDIILVDFYFFEFRSSAKRVPQVIHCADFARADFTADLFIPSPGESLSNQWEKLRVNDPIILSVCRR
jgi:hypothetical protein